MNLPLAFGFFIALGMFAGFQIGTAFAESRHYKKNWKESDL